MEDLSKEIKKEEKNAAKFLKNHSWMLVSVVLAIALIAAIFWPSGINQTKASEELVVYLNNQVGGGVILKDIEDLGSLYEVTVTYRGQDIPVYMTKDGKYMVQAAQEISATGAAISDYPEEAEEAPKSDKPIVNAFVFTYCPYGLQFQKALLPVYELLKNKADINLVQIGAMHGEFEQIEAYRQLCILDNYGKDKLWAYINLFQTNTSVGSCSSNMECSKPLVEDIMNKVGIDVSKINSCMETDAEALYNADVQKSSSLGVSGSPTFMINGVEVSVSRTPEAIKTAICDAFNEAPEECSETLSSSAMSAGFGGEAGTSTTASC